MINRADRLELSLARLEPNAGAIRAPSLGPPIERGCDAVARFAPTATSRPTDVSFVQSRPRRPLARLEAHSPIERRPEMRAPSDRCPAEARNEN